MISLMIKMGQVDFFLFKLVIKIGTQQILTLHLEQRSQDWTQVQQSRSRSVSFSASVRSTLEGATSELFAVEPCWQRK